MDKKDERNNNHDYMNDKEKTLYTQFLNQYRQIMIVRIMIVVLCIIGVAWISSLSFHEFFIQAMEIALLFICIMLYMAIKNKLVTSFMEPISLVISEECDSSVYYHVCKAIHEKYAKDRVVLQHYLLSLQLDHNDLSELKTVLKKYKKDQGQAFYLHAELNVLDEEAQKEYMERNYEKLVSPYVKAYQKTGNITYKNNVEYLEIKKLMLQNKYEQALEKCANLTAGETNFDKVRLAFIQGKCFMQLGKREAAQSAWEYVVERGNTLRMRYEAEQYLAIIHAEGKATSLN